MNEGNNTKDKIQSTKLWNLFLLFPNKYFFHFVFCTLYCVFLIQILAFPGIIEYYVRRVIGIVRVTGRNNFKKSNL